MVQQQHRHLDTGALCLGGLVEHTLSVESTWLLIHFGRPRARHIFAPVRAVPKIQHFGVVHADFADNVLLLLLCAAKTPLHALSRIIMLN